MKLGQPSCGCKCIIRLKPQLTRTAASMVACGMYLQTCRYGNGRVHDPHTKAWTRCVVAFDTLLRQSTTYE